MNDKRDLLYISKTFSIFTIKLNYLTNVFYYYTFAHFLKIENAFLI